MSGTGGFVDLRVRPGGTGIGDESVWPSFTDIMTVIVMIFMMALVVIMVRNFELGRELVSSTSARETTLRANLDLQERIAGLEGSLAGTAAERNALAESLAAELERLAALEAAQRTLEGDFAALAGREQAALAEIGVLAGREEAALAEIEVLAGRERAATGRITALTEAAAVAAVEIETLQAAGAAAQEQVAALREAGAAARAQIAELAQSESRQRAEIETLQAAAAAAQEQVAALREVEAAARTQIAELAQSESRQRGEIEALVAERGEATAEIARLTEAGATVVAELEALRDRLDAVSARLSTVERESGEQIGSLAAERDTLAGKIDALSAQLAGAEQALGESRAREAALEQDRAAAAREREWLSTQVLQRQAQIQSLEQQAATSRQDYHSLQEEYERLDARFRELARPARSPAGKYVVEVTVSKDEDAIQYTLREPDQAGAVAVDRAALEAQLQQLKEAYGESLYTRIVIPPDSGLLHDEAWRITQEILRRYDYYY